MAGISKVNPFARATRKQQRPRIALTGPAGSGKSEGALLLARQLVGAEGRIAVIDTENGEANYYAGFAGIGEFDVVTLRPPYLSSKYLELINAAIDAGYDALVVDSITHQWDGDGGILQRKEKADTVPGTNHWTNWGPFTEEYNRFRAALLQCPIFLICTMRSKVMYAQSEAGGKKKVEKLGMAPIQREGMDFEFSLVIDMDLTHLGTAVKGRADLTKIFDDRRIDLRDPRYGEAIVEWLETAEPLPAPPTPQQMEELAALASDALWTAREKIAMLKFGGAINTLDAMAEFLGKGVSTLVERKMKSAETEKAVFLGVDPAAPEGTRTVAIASDAVTVESKETSRETMQQVSEGTAQTKAPLVPELSLGVHEGLAGDAPADASAGSGSNGTASSVGSEEGEGEFTSDFRQFLDPPGTPAPAAVPKAKKTDGFVTPTKDFRTAAAGEGQGG